MVRGLFTTMLGITCTTDATRHGVLMAAVADERPQLLNKEFVRCTKVRPLANRHARAVSDFSGHALVDHGPTQVVRSSDLPPFLHIPKLAPVGLLRYEVAVVGQLLQYCLAAKSGQCQ